jgi:hypothetical protein
MRRLIVLSPLALVPISLAACGGEDGPCDPAAESCTYERLISEITVASGEEIDGLCQSWTLDNPTELWVSTVAMSNGGAYHHSNWFFVPDDTFVLPDGTWDCGDHEFDELTAAILGGYLFAQSTQVADDIQAFPDGAAVRIPPYSRVIGSSHLLNVSEAPITTTMQMHIETMPIDEVAVKLTPARIENHALTIEPNGLSDFTTDCELASVYEDTMGKPFELELYYGLAHYHQLGIHAQLELSGGPNDGMIVYRHEGYGESLGHALAPSIDVAALGATGLRYTCGFDNPRDAQVGWGIGDQEMCVTAIFAKTDMAFEGRADGGTGVVVGEAEDGTVLHDAPCGILGIPWDHDKPGGPPR